MLFVFFSIFNFFLPTFSMGNFREEQFLFSFSFRNTLYFEKQA